MITLIRLHLRTCGWFLVGWLLPMAGILAATPEGYRETFPTQEQLLGYAVPMGSSTAMAALYGPLKPPYTYGSVSNWQSASQVAVLGSVMAVLLAVKLTRAGEDAGVAELTGALGLRPRARTAAAGVVVLFAALLLGAIHAGAFLYRSGTVDGLPAADCVLAGAATAATTAAAGAGGLLAAELCATARSARIAALSAVGVAYLVRAVGDAKDWAVLRAVSPLGWRDVLRPFGDDARAWPLALMAAAVLGVAGFALAVHARRDTGAAWPGTRRARRTARRAPAGLGPWALRLRLDRPALLGWGAAAVAITAAMLMLTGEVADLSESSPESAAYMAAIAGGSGASYADAYVNAVGTVTAVIVLCAVIQTVLAVHGDEASGRLVHELAVGAPRHRPLLVSWATGLAASTLILAVSALVGSAVAQQGSSGDDVFAHGLWTIGGHWPALVCAAGVAALLAGALPRLTWLAWVVVVWSGIDSYLGELFGFPDWMLDWSLLAHAPRHLDGEFDWTGAVVLVTAGLLMALAGAWAAGRRDVIA
ncbi:hypothetical protein [Corynebacterium sp. 335C]